jgi:hypothetical protein
VVGSTREQATYWFQYGETSSYGQRTPVPKTATRIPARTCSR